MNRVQRRRASYERAEAAHRGERRRPVAVYRAPGSGSGSGSGGRSAPAGAAAAVGSPTAAAAAAAGYRLYRPIAAARLSVGGAPESDDDDEEVTDEDDNEDSERWESLNNQHDMMHSPNVDENENEWEEDEDGNEEDQEDEDNEDEHGENYLHEENYPAQRETHAWMSHYHNEAEQETVWDDDHGVAQHNHQRTAGFNNPSHCADPKHYHPLNFVDLTQTDSSSSMESSPARAAPHSAVATAAAASSSQPPPKNATRCLAWMLAGVALAATAEHYQYGTVVAGTTAAVLVGFALGRLTA